MTEVLDLQGCEHCSKEFPIDTMTSMGDFWICQVCYDGWKKEFDACEHHWTPEASEFGEPGQYCDKCSGFQLLDAVGESRCAEGPGSMDTRLTKLVIEWRDARQAVFDSGPEDDRPRLFEHLALCEHALMDCARTIDPVGGSRDA
jgi:hypothetical protein